MTIDPSNSRTLYFGTYRIWQTRDGAGQWLPISPDLTGGKNATIKAIAVAPSDPNTVYAGTSDGKVQVTNNALGGLKASWIDRSAGLTLKTLTSITVDPIDSATAYVTYSGFLDSARSPPSTCSRPPTPARSGPISAAICRIFRSTAWPWIRICPNTLYIGTDAGVMVTTNDGTSWSTLGNGMPKVVVEAVLLHRPTRILRAATHGRGVWDILIPVSSTAGSNNPSLQSVVAKHGERRWRRIYAFGDRSEFLQRNRAALEWSEPIQQGCGREAPHRANHRG